MNNPFDELAYMGHPVVDACQEYLAWGSTLSSNNYASYVMWLFRSGKLESWVKNVYTGHRSCSVDFTESLCPVSIYSYGTGLNLYAVVPWGKVIEVSDKTMMINHHQINSWLKDNRNINLYRLNTDYQKVKAAYKLITKTKTYTR